MSTSISSLSLSSSLISPSLRLIQDHPEWEILSYLRFIQCNHVIEEVQFPCALGMSTPVLIQKNSIYSGESILTYLYNEERKRENQEEKERKRIKYSYLKQVQEVLNTLLIRSGKYQLKSWFGTKWLTSAYQTVRNHFTAHR